MAIAAIWRKLLNTDRVGIYDDFFRAGGHSLLAIRLTSLLRSQLKLRLNVLDLFQNPTIAGLAAKADTQALTNSIEVKERPEHIPLSYNQEGLWIIDQFLASTSYHVFRQFTITGSLNVEALSYALKSLVKRHESLRTIYYEIDGTPYQKIRDADSWEVNIVTDVALADPEMRQQFVSQLVTIPFDLSADFMFRATLIYPKQDHALLVLTVHHIAVDGWSLGIMIRELVSLYQQYNEGIETLSPVRVQYADFAIWQREYSVSLVFQEKMQYWRSRLNDPTWLELPVDRASEHITYEGTTFNFAIDSRRASALKDLAREEGVTPYLLFIAVFNILLRRYTQQHDILIGTTASNRLHDDIANTVGYFVNSLVIRTHVDDHLLFTDYLKQVKQHVLTDLAHQDVPFDQIVSNVLTTRNVGHSNPLFRVMLDFINAQDIEQAQLKIPALTITESGIENHTTKFDLTLSVLEKENAFDAFIEYRADLFLDETIKRMSANFLQLFDSIITDRKSKVGALKMITVHEHDQIINYFNNTAKALPLGVTVLWFFRQQCLNQPESIALVHRDGKISFQELDRLSDAFAVKLIEMGVKPQTNVPVLANRGIDFIAAVVGIWKVGAVYIPFDPEYPTQRIEYMIHNSSAEFIVVDVKGKSTLPTGYYTIIDIDEVKGLTTPLTMEVGSPLPSDLAYVIYTSGSTGNPKGVMIEHIGMLNHIFACINELGLSSASTLSQNSSQSFDISIWQMFTGLVIGAKTIIFDNAQVLQIDNFVSTITEHKVTVLEVVPSYFRLMLEYFENQTDKNLDYLQYLIATGESVPAELVERWFTRFPSIKVVNAYGPAEASDDITFHIMDQSSGENNIPIGRPLQNVNIYIIDHFSNLCPIGIKGQICVSGIAVGRGYLNDEKRTVDSFTHDYIRGDKNLRLYHTGDIGRFNADGTISFFGRDDYQTKIRGHRIEFGEIESVLEASEFVRQAVVTKHKERDELIAYVVSIDGFHEELIRSHLKMKLPKYMIPAFIINLNKMPLNPNGKINRLALPPPPSVGRKVPKHLKAESELDKRLIEIWEIILKTEVPTITDDFFALGGNSLHVIRLLAAIRKQFNIEVSVTNFFNEPTIAALSRLIGLGPSLVMPDISLIGSRLQKWPLSFSQERLWFIDKLEGSTQYHIKIAYHLRGNLDQLMLESCLKEIVRRHEALRTVMVEERGTIFQDILPWENWNVTNIREAYAGTLEQYLYELSIVPFNLSTDYLIRAYLINVDVNSYVVLIVMHHIASDGWSCNLLQNELESLYNSKKVNSASPLVPIPLQYRDYSLWQHQTFTTHTAHKLQYWKNKLADVTPLLLPTDFKRPAERTVAGATVHFDIDEFTTEHLRVFSKRERVTLFMTLTAIFKILLFRHSNQTDITIGTPVANRGHESIENLIGFFVNTVVLRSTINPGQTFRSYLAEIRKVSLEAYENQDVPFEKIVAALVGDRTLNMNPLFQVMFILHNQVNGSNKDLSLSGVECSQIHFKESTAKFDLNLSVIESINSLHGVIEYSTDLFTAVRIERLAKHFQQLVKAIIQNPAEKVSKLKMLPDDEKELILTVFNHAVKSPTKESFRSVIEMFSTQARLRPDVIAVLNADDKITYRELDLISNQFAHYFKQLNIGKGSSIPVCMERNIEMIVVLLGILKAGAAYVPIDSAYPRERIAHMIKEINALHAVIHDSQESLFESSNIILLKVQNLAQQVAAYSREPLNAEISSDQLAYIIFTSGSTGKPKGILTEHGNISSFTKWCQDKYDKDSFEVVHSVSSISFDFTTMDIYYTLSIGKTLRILDNAFSLSDYIHRDRSVMINCVPSVLLALIRNKQGFGNISIVNMSGESIPKEVSEALHANPQIEARNLYGPTEATVISTSYDLDKENLSVIGRPISIARIYIMDSFGNLCPIGVSGEIWISGLGVAKGYVQATDKFARDPYSYESQSRVFKTGDQGRWLEDGNLEFLGRLDDQVKIRGYRIELGEIENVLRRGTWTKECIVHVKTHNSQKYIVAYVVPVGMPSHSDIYVHLKESLPEYMIPSAIIYLDKFTLSPNGKIDRQALPEPDFNNIFKYAHIAPRNSTESHVAQIWKRILRVDSISMVDNFYRLGGHSLMLVELLNNLRSLSAKLELKHLLKYQTIEEQARLILDVKNSHDPNPEWFKFIRPLSTEDELHSLFLIPGARGTSEPYFEFAEALSGTSVYGINLPGLWDGEEPLASIHEIASFVIDCIRSVQPRGPYCMIGHSFGGHVLFEIVKQLEISNERVDLAAMIDIPPIIQIESDPVEFVMRITGSILHFGKIFSTVYPEWFNIGKELKGLRSTDEMLDVLGNLVRTNLPDESSAVDLYMAIAKMEVRNVMMIKEPEGSVRTSLTIIKAAEGEYASLPDGLGWHEYAPIRSISLPGNHNSIVFGKNAKMMADFIKSEIENNHKNETE
ncbi:MAG: amino acid adenylation domain-containing protein [Flammeovirgaceae bacterium]